MENDAVKNVKNWNEEARIGALSSYSILDTPREEDFDDIVKMAAEACNVPVSLISFVATERQWFKAKVGIDADETALDVSICSHAILQRELFVVPDTTKDSRFAHNPLVAGDPNFRFYAGALLETPDGLPLGTVCVLDYKPRTLTDKEASALKSLARQVMTQLELRKTLSQLRGALQAKSHSEDRLKLALDASGFVGIWEWDIAKDRVFADERFVSVFGGEPHWSVEGAPIADYIKAIHPDDVERVKKSISIAIDSKQSFLEEYRLIQKDDSIRWVEARGQCLYDGSGKATRFPGAAVDITQRKANEQAIRDSASKFRFMAESMPQKIWTATPQGEISFFNHQWSEFTGLTFEQIRDWGWVQFIHPDDLEETLRIYKNAIAEVKPFEMQQRFRRKDGVYRWHLARGAPMRNEAGELIMWMGSNTDIDDQRQGAELLKKAAAKFEAVFDQATTFSGIMSLEGILLEANQAFLEDCGYRSEDQLGRPFWTCGWWRGSKEVQKKIEDGTAKAATGIPYLETLPFLLADGTERIADFALHPIRDETGAIIFLHPTGVDVTERLRSLAQSEFLSQLTQRLSIVADADEINRIATRAIGEFLGVHRCYFFQAMSELNQVRVLPNWCQETEEGLAGDYNLDEYGAPELVHALKRGPVNINDVRTHPWTQKAIPGYESLKLIAYTYAPFVHEGRWVACIGVSSENARQWTEDENALLENAVARVWPLIERARVEGALRQAQDALRNANNLLGDKASHLESVVQQRTATLQETIDELEAFSYSISHDMRAPLRAMRAFADILKQEYTAKLDPSGCDLLNRISQASRRMDQLIQDVLSFSQVSRRDVTLETVDPNKLVRELIESYPNLSPFVIDVSIPATLPFIKGNDALLTQCFSNLLDNAAKFVEEGTKPHVTITAECSEGRVKLLLQDNGIGMPAHSLERVFNIFQRVGRESTGTGIGLAIVRKAAEKIGGTAGVTSELNRGSIFWLDLQAA